MVTAEFPYSKTRGRDYPVIQLHIRSQNIEKDLDAIVDSEAWLSTFKAEVAENLGIQIENGEKRIAIGISGRIEVYIHKIEIKIFDKWFPCQVAFSRNLASEFNLLGREGFFDKHLITFNEKDKKTILTEF